MNFSEDGSGSLNYLPVLEALLYRGFTYLNCEFSEAIIESKTIKKENEMEQPDREEKNSFLHARSRYHGKVKPENLVFNANLQEFAQRVGYITNLETGGKLSPEESYKQIKALWKQLRRSKKALGIGKDAAE